MLRRFSVHLRLAKSDCMLRERKLASLQACGHSLLDHAQRNKAAILTAATIAAAKSGNSQGPACRHLLPVTRRCSSGRRQQQGGSHRKQRGDLLMPPPMQTQDVSSFIDHIVCFLIEQSVYCRPILSAHVTDCCEGRARRLQIRYHAVHGRLLRKG